MMSHITEIHDQSILAKARSAYTRINFNLPLVYCLEV
jgi:hypothetical protein